MTARELSLRGDRHQKRPCSREIGILFPDPVEQREDTIVGRVGIIERLLANRIESRFGSGVRHIR